MTSTTHTPRTVSLLLKSGGIVTLADPFILGTATAGTISDGTMVAIADDDVEEVR